MEDEATKSILETIIFVVSICIELLDVCWILIASIVSTIVRLNYENGIMFWSEW